MVPKLWDQTIDAHRREVREAIMETTARLVAEQGLASVTMSRIAEKAGIGRATLYKYFPDVETILRTWHQRQVSAHLEHLADVQGQDGDPLDRLEAVLGAYAHIHRQRVRHYGREPYGSELGSLLHRDEEVDGAQRQLHDMIRDLLADAVQAGHLRDDVAAEELASYCLHALTAASSLPSEDAVRRLVMVTLAGLRRSR